jgi:hypothetical protein
MKDGHEGSDEAAGKGEISTLLTSIPGTLAAGALGMNVAHFVALVAALVSGEGDVWLGALMELVVEGVLNAIGGGLKMFFSQLTVVLLLARVVMSGEDSVSAAGAVLAGVIVFGLKFVLHVGAEAVFVGSDAKGIGVGVESREGDGAAVRAEEVDKGVGLLVVGGELMEDLILMGAKPSYDVSVLQLWEDSYRLLHILILSLFEEANMVLQVVLLAFVEVIALKGGA